MNVSKKLWAIIALAVAAVLAMKFAQLLAILVIVAMAVAAHLLARNISRRIGQAAELANAVSHGRYDHHIDAQGKDEIAGLMRSLNTMQAKLLARQESDRIVTQEMSRLKCALDNVQVNVRVADNDGKLIYVNHTLRDTLLRCEKEFQREIPGFAADKVVGGSVGIFYADPQAALARLRNLNSVARSQLILGGRNYDVVTTPILSEAGEKLGSVGQWIDLTEQLRAETEISNIVAAAANGDFTQRVSLANKESFFLKLAQDINRLTETSEAGLKEVARVLAALAHADLTQTITSEYQGTYAQLKTDANTTVANLTDIISRVKGAANTINTAAQEISTGNADLSQRTEEQASTLEETASSMEELTSTVRQNAENARQANQFAQGASEVAVKGGTAVHQVVLTMSSISASSAKIADIISVIDGIAFQTNILALNAAVEAARAGEQGRGFAVVATEVRNLAQRSAAAAKEIKTLINDSVEKVEQGSHQVHLAGKTMDEIVSAVKRVTDIMGEITAASSEQSQGIEQVSRAITQMDEVTQQNAALVEQAAASAESLGEQANEMAQLMETFRMTGSRGGLHAPNRARLPATISSDANFSFDDAAIAHSKWKARLIDYIKGTSKEQLEVNKVSRDDQCPLGNWLYGAATAYANLPEYNELIKNHATFHKGVGEIVQCVHDQKHAAAMDKLGGDFFQYSSRTVKSIKSLQAKVEKGT